MLGKNTVMNAVFGTSLSSLVVAVATFVSGVLIARTLGPEARAEYGSVLVIGQTIATLAGLSFYDGAIVCLRSSGKDIKDAISTLVFSGIVIAIVSLSVTFGFFYFIRFDLFLLNDAQVMMVFGLLISSSLFSQCFNSAERIQMKFFLVNLARVTSPIIFAISIFIVWQTSGSSLSAWTALILFLLSKIPVQATWCIRYAKFIIGKIDLDLIKTSAITGIRLHFAITLGLIASQLDRLIAISAWPKELLGQYFVAFSAVGAGYAIITTAITTVVFPYFAGIDVGERQKKLSLILRITVFVSTVTVIGGMMVLPHAVPILYGSEYMRAKDLALGLLFASAILPVRAVILEANRAMGKGRPSSEMAIAQIGVLIVAFGFTGFQQPGHLIIAIGISNAASALVGGFHLWHSGTLKLRSSLLFQKEDVVSLLSMIRR